MADANVYAMSIEMNIEGNALNLLEKASNFAENLEKKLESISKKLLDFGDVSARSLRDFSTSASRATTEVERIPQILSGVRDAMMELQKADFTTATEEQAKKALEAYDVLKNKLDELRNQPTLSEAEVHMVDKLEARIVAFEQNRAKLQAQYQNALKDYQLKYGKMQEKELVNVKRLWVFDRQRIKDHRELLDLREQYVKAGLEEGSTEKDLRKISQSRNVARDREIRATDMVTGKLGVFSRVIKGIGGTFNTVASKLGSIISNLGGGELAKATTFWGLFEVAIFGAAKSEEKFHTLLWRNIGTMDHVAERIRKATKELGILEEEGYAAAVALRSVGATDKDIEDLTVATAAFVRNTDASVESTARFAKTVSAATGSQVKSLQQLAKMQKFQKQFGLTGRDLETVMGNVSDMSFRLGSEGAIGVERYTSTLGKATAAARSLGISTKGISGALKAVATDFVAAAPLLGGQAINMDAAERSEAWLRTFGEEYKKIQEAEVRGEHAVAAGYRKSLAARAQAAGVTEANLDELGQAAIKAEGDYDTFTKEIEKSQPADPMKELTASLKDTAGAMRETQKAFDSMVRNLKDFGMTVLPYITQVAKWFADNPAATWWTAAGIAAVGAISGIISVLGSVASILTTIGTFTGGTTGAGLLGALGSSFVFLGQAALVVGTAVAGFKLGEWLGDVIGLSDYTERVNKGTMTWKDTILTCISPVHALSAALAKLTEWYTKWESPERKFEDIAGAAALADKKGQEIFEKRVALDKRIKEAEKNHDKDAADAARKELAEINKAYLGKVAADKKALGISEKKKDVANQVAEAHKKEGDAALEAATKAEKAVAKSLESKEKQVAKAQSAAEQITRSEKYWADSAKAALAEAEKMRSEGFSEQDVAESLKVKTGRSEDQLTKMVGDFEAKKARIEKGLQEEIKKEAGQKENRAEITSPVPEIVVQPTEKPTAKAAPIYTVQIDEGTAKARDKQQETLDNQASELRQQTSKIAGLAEEIAKATHSEEMVRLLKTYLPQIVDTRKTGLASVANQWMT